MIIGLIIIALILGAHVYKLYKFTKLKKQAIDNMPESEHAMDEVQQEDYNGKDLSIKDEEREVWNKLSRKQKRWIMKEQEKKIKSGQYVKTPEGIITRSEAKKHGLI
jgi:Na+-translocating ferredoxin:NAD+ oxidoreductase RnfG subunit